MNSRPKDPKTARNKNVLIVGGSGSGKTRFWLKPNLLQCTSKTYPTSFVVTDPKGDIVVSCGHALQKNGYQIKILNSLNFKKSMHYNPFAYIHSEKDILKLVTTLIANTKGEGKAGDDFWVKAETLLYTALIGYIHYEAPVEEQNFSTLIEFINAMEVREDDEDFKNPVDLMFDELKKRKPDHFAVRQYLWQTVENKQKFISQIMTSKSPVRSCEDVDATALSFAEIKALCAGDPRIKERMDLDIEVSKLKIMKADHNSKQFRLEDSLLKYFPEKIEEHKGFVRGLDADMQTLAAHPLPAEGFVGMEIRGDRLTDKENAGAALLDTCKEVKGKDPVQIGSYRGFTMSVAFDSMWKTYTLTLKGQMTHRVELGSDARGNLVRIENALDKMPERLRSVQEQLENLYNQQAAAKAEVGKPFPQEQELAAKTARLIELDMELNLDGKGQPQPEQAIAKSARPSVLDRLKASPVHGAPEKPHKKEMEAR